MVALEVRRLVGDEGVGGGVRFQPTDASTIRYGLGAIKGTGESALSVILKARSDAGPFADLFEFCRRVDKRVVNRRVIEALIRAGAFDSLDDHRHKLLASVGVALEAAEQAERNALQGGLFDLGGADSAPQTHYVDVPRWGERERLLNEKQALGFFLSGHPFNEYAGELAAFVKRRLDKLAAQRDPVLMAGIVISTRTQMTRRGKMGVVSLDDGSGQLELTVFSELWDRERHKVREDEVLVVEGKVQRDDFSGNLRINADKLLTLGEARARFARQLRLTLNGKADARAGERLQRLLTPFRAGGGNEAGGCPVRIAYANGEARADLALPWRVTLDDALIGELTQWLERDNVEVVYH